MPRSSGLCTGWGLGWLSFNLCSRDFVSLCVDLILIIYMMIFGKRCTPHGGPS